MDGEISAAWEAKDRVSPPDPAMLDVIANVVAVTGVSEELMRSRVRRQPVAYARQIAMWQMHRKGYSLPKIGRFFGRDHTTVLHACKRVSEKMEQVECKA